eukprot:TRINITY_DN389_c0_g1_i1.p1 TRINITY_DN389_c0_g1~~TRINITY_DN389_c0_g1_i1.p1  ORF type:complete len:191 (-),score=47.60 TRINITY_DN389_c0_g1_i1:213-785(-)
MASSRCLRSILLGLLLLGSSHISSLTFTSPSSQIRMSKVVSKSARSAYESGKVNVGAEVSDTDVPPPPQPVLDCDEGCMTAIYDCMEEGCSVDALMKLDEKLAADEQKIATTVQEIEAQQKTAYSAENAGTLAWLNNFLGRSGSLRGQLRALKGVEDVDIVKQLMKAASVAFGGGREGDYPKVGVSPYTA